MKVILILAREFAKTVLWRETTHNSKRCFLQPSFLISALKIVQFLFFLFFSLFSWEWLVFKVLGYTELSRLYVELDGVCMYTRVSGTGVGK